MIINRTARNTFASLLILLICNLAFGSTTAIYPQNPDENERVERLITQGALLCSSRPDSALNYYKAATILADSLNNQDLQASGLCGAAKSYYILSEYQLALDNFSRALEIYREIENLPGIIYGLNGCGIALTMLDHPLLAIKKHREAIPLCEETEDYKQWAKNLFNISISFDALQEYDSSRIYCDSCLALVLEYEESNMIAKYQNHKGELELIAGDYEKALEIFQSSLNTPDFDNQWEIQFAKAGMAKAYLKMGRYEESIQYGNEAFQMAKKINSKWDIKEVAQTLYSAFEFIADYKQALEYHKIFKAYGDSLYNEEKQREINHQLLIEKENENKLLEQKNEVYSKEIKRKNLLIAGFIILVLLAALFVFIVLRLYRLKTHLIAEINENSRKIEIQNKQLAEVNETKDKLFRIIAHDLKTPIGTVIQFTELLQENYETYSKETVQKFLGLLNKSSRQGFELLNNLLNWAQMQTGDIPFNPERLPLLDVIVSTTNLVLSQAELKDLKIEIDISKDLIVYADEKLFRIIFRNLLSNAIKFSYPGQKVIISTIQLPAEIQVCIRDFGIGIPLHLQSRIFHLGKDTSQPGTRDEKGTGLGLALCKEFVDKHGGRIWIEPDVKTGSMFCFTLPIEKN